MKSTDNSRDEVNRILGRPPKSRLDADFIGKKHNKLTAVEFACRKGKVYFWLFRCDCGNEKVIGRQYVVNGNTKSCGCLRKKLGIF